MDSIPSTIVDVFARHLSDGPGEVAMCALERNEARETWTRADLWNRAHAMADVLAARGIGPGDRVLVEQPDGPELAAIFFALWLRRAVALMVPSGLAPAEAAGIETHARPVLVIGPLAPAGRPPRTAPCLDVAEVVGPVETANRPTNPDSALRPLPSDLAFVQYGSGPQLTPRGIMLSHGALAANIEALGRALGVGPTDRALSWSPMSHDMGLVGGVMMALAWGYPVDLMKAEAVLVQPVRWLEALGARGATLTAGPNFAWQMCVRRVRDADLPRLDLSRLRVALTGSETVQADTCRAFSARFAASGFRAEAFTAAYGLAEHVLAVSVTPPGRALSLGPGGVACGRPFPGHDVCVRDGEILVRGPSVMNGYLDAPEATARVLGADGWLHTGDLGAFHDGEIVVLGRRKEMVIRRGKNFYIDDVECLVRRDASVRSVFATAIPDTREGTEGLMIMAESALVGDASAEAALAQTIVGEILNHLGLGGARVCVVGPGSLPRAGSALDRTACRRLALETAP